MEREHGHIHSPHSHGAEAHAHGHDSRPSVLADQHLAETRLHSHAHGHGDRHDHTPPNYNRAFAVGLALNVAFVVIEAGFSFLSGSLALLADAGHNLSDVLALAVAWGAMALSRRVPTARRTYGWRRSSILAALANALALVVVVGAVSWEALHRLVDPRPVEGGLMILVAAIGVLVNGIAALLFIERRTDNRDPSNGVGPQPDANVRAAFLHLATDAAVSVGVVVAGIAMLATGWVWLDPAISLVIGAAILLSTWGLLRDALDLAMDAVPAGIDERGVRTYLEGLPGVLAVHDLHIWAMSTTQTALTAHLVMRALPQGDSLLCQATDDLSARFAIEHPTLQIECGDPDFPCALAPAHLV